MSILVSLYGMSETVHTENVIQEVKPDKKQE